MGLPSSRSQPGSASAMALMNGWWNTITRSVPVCAITSRISGTLGNDLATMR